MDNVVNNTAATPIPAFLERLYLPIYKWAKEMFATKAEVAARTEQMTSQEAHAIWADYNFSTTD